MRSFREIRNDKNVKLIRRFSSGIHFYWKNNNTKFFVAATTDPVHGDHVSVSHKNVSIKLTFDQMVQLRDVCFKENEITHFYMKHDGKKLIKENCYHIFRELDELITA